MFKWISRLLKSRKHEYLHGFNLNVWNYVGRSMIYYEETGIKFPAHVYFFEKKNSNKRNYIIVPDGSVPKYLKGEFKIHCWVLQFAEIWRIGEYELHSIINQDPSQWLREKMLTEYNKKWDYQLLNWKKIPPKISEDNNIVTLNFKKTVDKDT